MKRVPRLALKTRMKINTTQLSAGSTCTTRRSSPGKQAVTASAIILIHCLWPLLNLTENIPRLSVEYSSSRNYDTLGLAKEGDDFFGTARRLGEKFVYTDDLPIYRDFFTKENILKEIRKNGLFVMQYRLIVDGKPVYINARAALVEEKEGPKLIIGLNNVDTQVKIGKKRKAQNRVK